MDSLEALNERFWTWLEKDYHRRVHASLEGRTPLEVFQSQIETVTFLDNPEILDTIFLKRYSRKVKLDGTITLNKTLYEVPRQYIGTSIDIREDHHAVYVYEEDRQVAEAVPVSMTDNAHVKRTRSPFTLNLSNPRGDDSDV